MFNPSFPLLSRHSANALFGGVLLGGFMVASLSGYPWPLSAVAIGASLVVRQLVRGRPFDALVSLLVCCLTVQEWIPLFQVFALPAALTLLVRELLHIRREEPDVKWEELRQEMEEERRNDQ